MNITSPYKELRSNLAQALIHDGAFLTRDMDHPLVVTRGNERGFKLQLHEANPDAPLSPYYFNIRVSDNPTKPGTLTPNTVGLAATCMYALVSDYGLKFDYVAGVPNAGDPFAKYFCSTSARLVRRLQLVKGERDGKRSIESIEGPPPQKWSVVLVLDDLVTKAGSKLLVTTMLEGQYDLIVKDIVVIVDRDQGGREELKAKGYDLHSIFTVTELLDACLKLGEISQDFYTASMAYHHANR